MIGSKIGHRLTRLPLSPSLRPAHARRPDATRAMTTLSVQIRVRFAAATARRPLRTLSRGRLVVHARSRFSEQFGDAGAPVKPGTLQSPPLYVKRTLRAGQVVRHPGTIIVSATPFPSPARESARARIPEPAVGRACRLSIATVERSFAILPPSTRSHPLFSSPRSPPFLLSLSFPTQVYGNCEQHSELIAGGDVFVWGSLRGDVVAGSKGDSRARVFSLDMRPGCLTIGGVKSVARGGAVGAVSVASGVPEVAEVDTNGSGIVMSPANGSAKRLAEGMEAKNEAIRDGAKARFAAKVTGIYIALAGFALIFAPAQVFGLLFSIEAITDAWIRVFGVLCVAFGTYYVGGAMGDAMGKGAAGFYQATVVGRVWIFLAFLALVGTGYHPEPSLLILGFINFAGALVMMHAMSNNKQGKEGGGKKRRNRVTA